MSQGLFTAVSGIKACQAKIDVIADNIANMNTVAFKASKVNFESVFARTLSSGSAPGSSVGGTNPMQIGLGTAVGEIGRSFTGGTVQSTGRTTDLNIQGEGFFTVASPDGSIMLTRAGNFSVDSNGNMVDAKGLKVLGTSSSLSGSGSTIPIRIPQSLTLTNPAAATTSVITDVTNSSGTAITSGSITVTRGATTNTYTITEGATTLQSLVNSINTDFGAGTASLSGGALTLTNTSATEAVNLSSTETNFLTVLGLSSSIAASSSATSGTLSDSSKITIAAGDGSANSYPLSSYSIGKDGSIEATYANGSKLTVTGNPTRELIYKAATGKEISNANITVSGGAVQAAELQLQVANVLNPKGLVSQGGNTFAFAPNAGAPTFGCARTGGLGLIDSGGLESSNVDLPTEFAEMILAQRGIDANSRTFDTQNQIMRQIVNMGR